MNWEAIGAVGEILGAIAVLATLVYLAIRFVRYANRLWREEQKSRWRYFQTGVERY
ncbi:MAG: hypothetical protein GKR90_17595 [Pseudomonadales bacterium]|nr:hypothetical protein [Pseudomonadales bacterium]